MKIIKISANPNKMIAIDPNAKADPNVQMQNYQSAMQAINDLMRQVQIPNQLTMQFSKQLENNINAVATQYQLIGLAQSIDISALVQTFKAKVSEKMDEIILNSDNFNMLQNMGIISSVNQLRDNNYMNSQVTNINKKIQEFSNNTMPVNK